MQVQLLPSSFLLFLFVLPLLAHPPPSATPTSARATPPKCKKDFLSSFPFFQASPLRYRAQEISFLTEFSRFMNQKAPEMLKVIIR